MLRSLLIFQVVLLFLFSSSLTAKEPENYCKDSNSWTKWENLARKYPSDQDIQLLHALRIGLCIKIEKGSITQNMAVDIFDQAHDYVINKKKEEQGKSGIEPGGLQGF